MIRPKGVDLLLAAQARLDAEGVAVAIELYGRSDDGNPEAIPTAELEAWGRSGRGKWLGHTSDVAGVWRRSDIFVLPARSREGMPRALLEAAASARPLIVTDVPGCRHFVRDGIEGLVVPPNDVAALTAALVRLATDPDLRVQMGLAARARCLSRTPRTVRPTPRRPSGARVSSRTAPVSCALGSTRKVASRANRECFDAKRAAARTRRISSRARA